MPEKELIEYIRELTRSTQPPWLRLGVGDDAALIEPPGGGTLAVTTDMLVEGVHFEPGTAPDRVGWKAMARGLSDVAAMAARPLCTVAGVHFGPRADAEEARELVRALVRAADELGAPLIGGDVARGGPCYCLTVTALATPGPRGFIRRDGARLGDAVCVTGALGGSIRGRHLSFRPRIAEALELVAAVAVHAMTDVSDGLSTDALHLAEAGGAGIVLEAARIPVSADARELAGGDEARALARALNDGEDYELLFCLPRAQAELVEASGLGGVPVTIIGEVAEGAESWLVHPDGRREPLRPGGWEYDL